jgi:hypothetical protein
VVDHQNAAAALGFSQLLSLDTHSPSMAFLPARAYADECLSGKLKVSPNRSHNGHGIQ